MRAPGVDFKAMGIAIVRAVRLCLDIDPQKVIFLQPEDSVAPRPALPYVSVYFSIPSTSYGWDVSHTTDDEQELIQGPRSMAVDFVCYAETHAEANGMASVLEVAIFSQVVRAYLKAQACIAVWDCTDVTDESKALDTGFEARSKIGATFGVLSSLQLPSQGTIASATVSGSPLGDDVITIGETEQ